MKRTIVIIFLLVFTLSAESQESKLSNITLNGYVKYMNTVMFSDIDDVWMSDNMIHNRLNFRWYASNNLTVGLELRNRFIYGDFIKNIPRYSNIIANDNGYLDMSNNIFSEKSFLINTNIDRAWVEYNKNSWNIKLGRQRINWGQNFVWNPNDIFNSYSFFDFDYEERPGSDAIRVQYYNSYTSVIEGAVSISSNEEITAAGFYRFNKFAYDFQVLAGIINSNDYVIGTGWSGSIKDVAWNGEITYLMPKDNLADSSGVLLTSVGASYMFNNSIYVNAEILYNGNAKNINIAGLSQYYYQPMSIKTLSFSKWSYFAQASYPIHPLLDGTFSVMYYPQIKAYFFGPSLKYSLQDNFSISLNAQIFKGEFSSQTTEKLNMLFFRLRWSF
ncbi:MAG: hypothetical protein PF487_01200 [Bacteroidales bacterium]|jgi:hypothetical protein|nr:hypothetical protein [Bacteroidales bacterium]